LLKGPDRNERVFQISGSRERELAVNMRLRGCMAVRASGTTGLGAGAKRLVDDGLDGARATPALGAAAEAPIDLLGIAGKVFCGIDGATDIVVADDIAGTNNHENGRPFGDARTSILKAAAGCKRKNRVFK
jgi:hypothetical protein